MARLPDGMIWADAVDPKKAGHPGLNPRTVRTEGMIIDYDLAVTMRDGKKIYIDLYRPDRPGKFPPILNWGPYGKQGVVKHAAMPNTLLKDEDFNEHTKFEAGDAVYWCRYGYALINPDPRGAWMSEGDLTWMSSQEVEDIYDLIEWAGVQPWSNGKVGMQGVSYLAWSQWNVAAANPPHLAAINPWEGVSDYYRELATHEGIPEQLFCAMWQDNVHYSTTRVEDWMAMKKAHPLFDEYWADKCPDLTKINVPAFVVASWTDHGLHNRGTVNGYEQISSKDKYLLVHGRKKWWHFYQMENVEKQRQFFNRYLKGIDNHVKDWPKVTLEIREGYYKGQNRNENEWPIARTQYTKYFLDAAKGSLSTTAPAAEASKKYNVDRVYKIADDSEYTKYFLEAVDSMGLKKVKVPAGEEKIEAEKVTFEIQFPERTELTGHMNLRLWVQADGSDDMDLFVALEKVDTAGCLVPFAFFGNHDDGAIALGWLRASHRELDEAKSKPYQPIHKHTRELKLSPGEIVPVDIEILPTSVLFEKGERLRLVVSGSDIYWFPTEGHTDGHLDTVNKGDHILYTGGKYESFLLAPVIPPR